MCYIFFYVLRVKVAETGSKLSEISAKPFFDQELLFGRRSKTSLSITSGSRKKGSNTGGG